MTIPLDGKLTFAKLDASQTSRPHVFLLTSREPLKLTLDSFTRATTEVDFQARAKLAPGGRGGGWRLFGRSPYRRATQAPNAQLMQDWLDDLMYVCADPCAGAASEAALSSSLSKTL